MRDRLNSRRQLVLLRILFLETSASRPMGIQTILRRLEEEGCPAERKAVYNIIKTMNDQGVAIRYQRRTKKNPSGWYYAGGWLDGTAPDE